MCIGNQFPEGIKIYRHIAFHRSDHLSFHSRTCAHGASWTRTGSCVLYGLRCDVHCGIVPFYHYASRDWLDRGGHCRIVLCLASNNVPGSLRTSCGCRSCGGRHRTCVPCGIHPFGICCDNLGNVNKYVINFFQ